MGQYFRWCTLFQHYFHPTRVAGNVCDGRSSGTSLENVPLKQAKLQLWLLPVAVLLALGLIYHTVSQTHLFKIEPLPVVFVSLAFWIILTHLPYLRFYVENPPACNAFGTYWLCDLCDLVR